MRRIKSENLTILGIALTLVLLLSWGEFQVVAQSTGHGIGNIVGNAAGSLDGSIGGGNPGGEAGNNATGGTSANLSADFRASLGNNGDSSGQQNGDNNSGQQTSRSGSDQQTTAKPENFFNKMKDMFTGGSTTTPAPPAQQQTTTSPPSSIGMNFTESLRSSGTENSSNGSTTSKPEGGLLGKMENKIADMSRSAHDSFNHTMEASRNGTSRNGNEGNSTSSDGLGSKISKAMNKGADLLKESGSKFEEKASEIGEKAKNFTSRLDMAVHNATSRDGDSNNNNSKNMTQSMKDFVNNTKNKENQQSNGERSGLSDDGKNIMVELFDKAHELSKMPMETLLKPLDKMLGVDKDPLLKMMDSSHDALRKPFDKLTKPMDSMLDEAFKLSDELEKEHPNKPNQKKSNDSHSENHKKSDRSVMGDIADKAVELAQSPLELILKPLDKLLGNSDRKNPLLRLIDDVYGLSKKPVDKFAKPLEEMLRKMANGYQLSVEYSDVEDPKLVTRLADGALNVADRVVTKPIEAAMRPLSRILGYDDKKKKNSIVEAAHAWKNATRLGLELLTKPIDRIIKEIADLGDIKDDEEREEEYKRRREEASRLVELFDKIHDAAQTPFEIVLRPVNKMLGSEKKGHKQSILRAWDLLHYVLRVPIQVVSKPVEDALLGERTKKQQEKGGKSGGAHAQASAGTSSSEASSRTGLSKSKKDRKKGENRKNFFVDSIKKAEKYAIRPLDLLSLPMRKLILGSHDKKNNDSKHHTGNTNAKSNGNSNSGNSVNVSDSSSHNDKIVTTIEKINNVLLTPMELLTQPIADKLFSNKGGELKIDARLSTNFTPNNSSSTTTTKSPQHFSTTTTTSTSTTTTTTTTRAPQSGSSKDKKDDKPQGFNATISSNTQGQMSKG